MVLLLLRTSRPVPFGTFICSTVETNPFSRLVVTISGLFTSNIPRYVLDFALFKMQLNLFTGPLFIARFLAIAKNESERRHNRMDGSRVTEKRFFVPLEFEIPCYR